MDTLQPRRPTHLPDYSELCLQALVARGLAGKISLFSFQIARRSAQLEPAQPAPWIQVPLDSLADLVASKMVALIERGSPRDFRDIYAVCQAGLLTPRECWQLWQRRQQAAGSAADFDRAKLAVQTHLARIAQHRRLEQIADPIQQQQAEAVRTWYMGEFLDAAA